MVVVGLFVDVLPTALEDFDRCFVLLMFEIVKAWFHKCFVCLVHTTFYFVLFCFTCFLFVTGCVVAVVLFVCLFVVVLFVSAFIVLF